MREENHRDRDQWIPWEISYSLKEVSRRDKRGNAVTSRSNAMIGVVLSDQQGLYSYYYESNDCCSRNCVTNHTEKLFKILRMNMFNYNYGETRRCDTVGEEIWFGEHSYIETVRWKDFIADYNYYIDKAIERQQNIDSYDIHKEV